MVHFCQDNICYFLPEKSSVIFKSICYFIIICTNANECDKEQEGDKLE